MRVLLNVCVKLSALVLVASCGLAAARAQGAAACPRVEVVCPETTVGATPDLNFSVKIDPPGDPSRLAYEWSVSAGVIVSGLGTPSITLNASGVYPVGPTVTVDVRGLPEGCPASASCTVQPAIGCGRAMDEYGDIRFNDEKARLDNLAVELQNGPDATGHIICYAGRRARAGEARARCERAKNYLISERGIEPSRVVTVDGGHRENLTVSFWAVPRGVTPPTPSPTVDPSEVTVVKTASTRKRRRP